MIQDLVDERAACAVRLAELDRQIAHAMLAVHQDVQPEHPDDRLLTVTEAAARLSVKASYPYDLIRRDVVPCVKVGKFIRVKLSTVVAIKTGRIEEKLAMTLCVLDLCGVHAADPRELVVGEPPRR